jgi:NADP-dependent 3-hydroxy acid dehydrogenase YdfG
VWAAPTSRHVGRPHHDRRDETTEDAVTTDGRVLLITGASSGIGAGIARAAVDAGHRVVLQARRREPLDALADELGPDRARSVPGDVTEPDDQQRAVDAALDAYGRIDVAVANAGYGSGRGFLDPDGDPERWRGMVLTNVYGVALTARATLPHLVASTGHLVLMGSVAGRITLPGSLYAATKWAVTGMGQAIRAELHGTGVRVTVVEPGRVATPFFAEPPTDALETDDVVAAVMYAIDQPPHVDVNEIMLRPISQRR